MADQPPPPASNEAPPSSVGSAAKPISAAAFQQEISAPSSSPTPPSPSEMKGERVPPSSESGKEPVKARQIFKDESTPGNVTLGDDKGNRVTEKTMPDFADAARKLMEKKAAEEAKPAPEAKPTTTPAEKPAAETKPAPEAKPAAEEVPEDQRQVLPHDKPDTAKRIKFFLAETKRLAEEATQAKKELEEVRKQPKTEANVEEVAKLKEEYNKLQDEATRYRRRYDLENDPEFSAKYRAPVQQVEQSITSTFKRYGLGDATLKAIADEGGFAEFSRSQRTFPVVVADPEGEGGTITVQKTASELSHEWLKGMAVADAEAIKSSIGQQQLLKSEYHGAVKKAMDESKQYFEKQTVAQREAQAKQEEAVKKSTEEYAAWAKKTEAEVDFLKDKPIPQEATPDQRKEIEDYNAFSAQLRGSLNKHPANAIEYGQLKLDAAEAHHLRRTLGSKDSEIAALKEQLAKTKGAMRTTGRSGSLLTGGGAKSDGEPAPADPTDFKSIMRKKANAMSGSIED